MMYLHCPLLYQWTQHLVIQDQLAQDTSLWDRTVLSVQNITVTRVLHTQYIFYLSRPVPWTGRGGSYLISSQFQSGQFIHGAFGRKSLSTASTPRLWIRYLDDTFVIQQEGHKQTFLEHTNKMVPAIKFTVEGNQENGAIPFPDTSVKLEADNTLSITVYRKPKHTDQYLHWDIHHNLAAKYSVISTLTHKA